MEKKAKLALERWAFWAVYTKIFVNRITKEREKKNVEANCFQFNDNGREIRYVFIQVPTRSAIILSGNFSYFFFLFFSDGRYSTESTFCNGRNVDSTLRCAVGAIPFSNTIIDRITSEKTDQKRKKLKKENDPMRMKFGVNRQSMLKKKKGKSKITELNVYTFSLWAKMIVNMDWWIENSEISER